MLEGDKRMRCHAPNITDGHVDKLLAGESTQVWLGFEVANIDKWREVSLRGGPPPTVDNDILRHKFCQKMSKIVVKCRNWS